MFLRTPDGRSALHHACLHGRLNVVKWLTARGADMSAINNYGLTPISDACYGGHLDIMQYLALEGASFTVRTSGNSPIHIACEEGYLDIVKWLMEQGVAADIYDDTGKTPFLYACFHGTSFSYRNVYYDSDMFPFDYFYRSF